MIFNYSKKQKIILSTILVGLIIITIVLISFSKSQYKDLQIISQANFFASSLAIVLFPVDEKPSMAIVILFLIYFLFKSNSKLKVLEFVAEWNLEYA